MSRNKIPLIDRATRHADRTAIIVEKERFNYTQLLDASSRVAAALLEGCNDLVEKRVAFLTPANFAYAATQWGIWRAGGIAVPLCVNHPPPEWDYVINDCSASVVVAHPQFAPLLRPIAKARKLRFLLSTEACDTPGCELPQVEPARRAMIVYTSGTTGKPKGVVTTHQNITAQIHSLIEPWGWTPDDQILLVLPLHHVHGIINVVACALWAGAACEMMPQFEAQAVWNRICEGGLTLFMAVPIIYAKLADAWQAAPADRQKLMSDSCRTIRLMLSGSAALPVTTLETWRSISGHTLLERYGMTEIGMAISNPLVGERVPGHIGSPLPSVDIRLIGEDGNPVIDESAGEIQVRGPSVFIEYWNRPEETGSSFVDGWFKTGDVAIRKDNIYRILGRRSVDIIKTGGEKVSAIEVEEVLRTHDAIDECAVVGLPDAEWGQRVGAAVVLKTGRHLALDELRTWAREQLAIDKVPSRLIVTAELPRNAMGKVTKPQVVKLFADCSL